MGRMRAPPSLRTELFVAPPPCSATRLPLTHRKPLLRLCAPASRRVCPSRSSAHGCACLVANTPYIGSQPHAILPYLPVGDEFRMNSWRNFLEIRQGEVAYTLAAVAPERVGAIAALALPYQPRGAFYVPPFEQARAFLYQWLLCLEEGARAVAADPVGFARIQWDTWSPPGWFDH